jgi:hypothetical protein
LIALRALAVALGALALSGCVSKLAYGRVKSALTDAGLSEANAACMANRMTDKLTILQLRKLEALTGEKRSIADYVAAVRRVGDPEVLAVTATAAAVCTTGIGR